MRLLKILTAIMLVTGLTACNYYELDAGGNIGFNNNTDPITGMPGAACTVDEDCLSQDCNDGAGVCR